MPDETPKPEASSTSRARVLGAALVGAALITGAVIGLIPDRDDATPRVPDAGVMIPEVCLPCGCGCTEQPTDP